MNKIIKKQWRLSFISIIFVLVLMTGATTYILYQLTDGFHSVTAFPPIDSAFATVPLVYQIIGVMAFVTLVIISLFLFTTTQLLMPLRRLYSINDKLQEQKSKRAREKDRLNTVLTYMADGVLILKKSGKIRFINPAALRLFNTTEEEALKVSFDQIIQNDHLVALWARCVESGQEEIAAFEIDDDKFVRFVVTPFLKGDAQGYLVIIQNLTRMRRLQTVRQDFISNVSHELRTPLASLRALVDTLRDGAMDDPPAAKHFLDRAEIELDALTQMVEELLQLSRIESGHAPLQFCPTSANDIILPVLERLRPQIVRAKLTCVVDLPRHLPELFIDYKQVQQVVTNLVYNSIKFTPIDGQITISALHKNETVVLSIADTGVGIPAEALPRIFERFYKVDRARSTVGTGLGLAIAKHIIQAHEGKIWAESVEGEGSTFYFSLPIVQ